MDTAHYSVIRYMPDPGRGERLNVGILLWTPNRYCVRIDETAVDRVVRENPRLARESIFYVSPLLREKLSGEGSVEERVASLLNGQRGFPMDLSEARFTSVLNYSPDALGDAVDSLLERVVRHKRRRGGSGHDPRQALERRLKVYLKRGLVEKNHSFSSSRSGVARAVDFFANTRINTALDVLKLDLKRADDIRNRADAEAFKVYDITRENDVRFAVYCDLSDDRSLADANDEAQRVIESAGATVVTDPEAAARAVIAS
jgi:hypothetical protein